MEYVICEQRPRHYSIQLAPLPVETLELASVVSEPHMLPTVESLLAQLQEVGVGGALTVDNIVLLDVPNGDYLVNYRYSKDHTDQDWLRLVPIKELGKRIYHGCYTDALGCKI